VIDPKIPVLLEASRCRAGIDLAELWWDYIGLGGMASPSQLSDILAGVSEPQRMDYDLLAQVLNDRFSEIDMDHPVPYADEVADALAGVETPPADR